MPLLPSLPAPSHLADMFRRFPRGLAPLLEYHDAVLRSDGALTIGQRELVAAYVSGLNACTFCMDSHVIYAHAFGIAPETVGALLADIDTAPVEDRMKPILRYVRKLTSLPSRIVEADVQAVLDAGWSEDALYEAIQTCALFNMMNRLVEGTGVDFIYADEPERHPVNQAGFNPDLHRYRQFGEKVAAKHANDTTKG